MNPFEYIDFQEDNIISNCTEGNRFTDSQASEYLVLIGEYIKRLEIVKKSEVQTKTIVEELIQYSENPKEVSQWNVPKYKFIIHWLLKAIWIDETFYYSKIPLAQYYNRISQLNAYDVKNELKSETELYELFNSKKLITRYIIESNSQIQKIYNICRKAYDCEFLSFREGIETANFNKMNIQKQNIVQDLTFRLSGIMGSDWYTDVCKNMKWEKSTVSGQGSKLEGNLLIKELDRILPRPKR